MTREEAIKIIDCYDIGFYDLSGEKIPADKLADAFDMAIEALSAEAPKPTVDLISRADAIALLTKIVFDEPPYLDSETLCRLYAEEQINTLPSAEAADVYKAHEEEHLNIANRIKELQYAIAKTQTIVGKMVEKGGDDE